MISDKLKSKISELNLEYCAVAIKFWLEKPSCPHFDGDKNAFCTYVNAVQKSGKRFYIEEADDMCYGKVSLGMIEPPPVTASGQAGFDFGCYQTPAACRGLYQNLPTIIKGTVKYVEFCPVADCDFDPDLVVFVASLPQADIIMRATSWISGEPWESKSSPVLSCAWMYAYPVISGKVNHITTGFYHGLKRRKLYPEGLRMISVPFQKLPEFEKGLCEMDWTLIAFRDDENSRADLAEKMTHWQKMAEECGSSVALKDER